MRVPDEGYYRNASCALNSIYTFFVQSELWRHDFWVSIFVSYVYGMLGYTYKVASIKWGKNINYNKGEFGTLKLVQPATLFYWSTKCSYTLPWNKLIMYICVRDVEYNFFLCFLWLAEEISELFRQWRFCFIHIIFDCHNNG
jgi:hypothetical protein